jgi:ferredoxin-NADP reductase
MLTEPLTSPTTEKGQRWYAALVGALFPPQVSLLGVYSTPELALVAGNVFSYIISPKTKLLLKIHDTFAWGPTTIDFLFKPARQFAYQPGQYMEFTLPHKESDNRGSRRYFTLASSPTEDTLRIGVRFYDNGSSFKKTLRNIDDTNSIAASQLGGDFTLPKDPTQKLAFIAGGIGITPFRSMLKYLIDTHDSRFATLFYSERNAHELAYSDVLLAAQQQPNMRVVYTLTDKDTLVPQGMNTGYITADMIKRELPDFQERLFYISGPQSMVTNMRSTLKGIGVHDRNIKVDFFSGYAS